MEFPSLFSVLPNSPLSLRTDSSCGHLNLTGCRRVACCAAGLYPYHPLLLCFSQNAVFFHSWQMDLQVDSLMMLSVWANNPSCHLISAVSKQCHGLRGRDSNCYWLSEEADDTLTLSLIFTMRDCQTQLNNKSLVLLKRTGADFSFQLSYDKH